MISNACFFNSLALISLKVVKPSFRSNFTSAIFTCIICGHILSVLSIASTINAILKSGVPSCISEVCGYMFIIVYKLSTASGALYVIGHRVFFCGIFCVVYIWSLNLQTKIQPANRNNKKKMTKYFRLTFLIFITVNFLIFHYVENFSFRIIIIR